MIGAYFGDLEGRLSSFPLAIAVETVTEQVDLDRGFVKAKVTFTDRSELHIFEYVMIEDGTPERRNYRYHYQTAEGGLIRRWDDAPHHPELRTAPHHLHEGDRVLPSQAPDLEDILADVARRLRSEPTSSP